MTSSESDVKKSTLFDSLSALYANDTRFNSIVLIQGNSWARQFVLMNRWGKKTRCRALTTGSRAYTECSLDFSRQFIDIIRKRNPLLFVVNDEAAFYSSSVRRLRSCSPRLPYPLFAWVRVLDANQSHYSDRYLWSVRHRLERRACRWDEMSRLVPQPGFSIGCLFHRWAKSLSPNPQSKRIACTCICSRQQSRGEHRSEEARDLRVQQRARKQNRASIGAVSNFQGRVCRAAKHGVTRLKSVLGEQGVAGVYRSIWAASSVTAAKRAQRL